MVAHPNLSALRIFLLCGLALLVLVVGADGTHDAAGQSGEGTAAGPIKCKGLVATKVGTPGSDTINGTSGNDVIHARGGHDTVYGKGGNDIICGGSGADQLFGGGGDDGIYGGKGKDNIRGGSGKDGLKGGSSNDKINGKGGKDACLGGAGADVLTSCERRCASAYPTICLPPPPPDLNCGDIPYRNFKVRSADPHKLDSDKDGIGCES